jgi:hypothetical protein
MITVSLYHKYRTALDDIAQDSADRQHITTNAANLALLLAMQELDAAWRERCLPAQAAPRQDRQQFIRINEWLAEHAPSEYYADGDTADAIIAAADRLRGTVERLRQDLATAIAERDESDGLLAKLADWLADKPIVGDSNEVDLAIALMSSQAAEIKRLNADLATLRSYAIATPHGNGKSQPAVQLSPTDQPEQYPPAIVAAVEQAAEVLAQEAAAEAAQQAALDVGDDAELHDYIIGLDAKRHAWRTIPKSVRWRLVKARLNSIWTDGKLPTMADFDAYAPAWMPSANSVAMTFGDGKWSVVCGKAVES